MARILRAGTCVHKPYKFISFTVDGIPVKLPESVAALPACYESAIKTLENEGFPEENWRVGVAFDAYQMADAMLIARNIER